MKKILWDAIKECRKKWKVVDDPEAYCIDCPVGCECAEIDEQEMSKKRGNK